MDYILGLIRSRCTDVTLSDNSNSYDSLDEMKTHDGPTIKVLNIKFANPFGYLSLGTDYDWPLSTRNSLRIMTDSSEAELLFVKIRDALIPHERRFARIFSPLVYLPTLLVFLIISWLGPHLPISSAALKTLLHITLIWLIVCFALSIYFTARGGTVVCLEPRKGKPGFLSTHRDELVKYVMFTAIGALIQWLVSHLLK